MIFLIYVLKFENLISYKMKILRTIVIILIILVLIPVVSWLFWNLKPSRPIDLLVLDKTVLSLDHEEHRALFWLLNNEKFVKSDKKAYNKNKDYFGFHPQKPLKAKKYDINSSFKMEEIDEVVASNDGIYYADMRGVYFNEWYERPMASGMGNIIEGGLNNSDYLLLKRMYEENKLIVMEYNFFGPPTDEFVRYRTENLIDVHWTGWSGKYFHHLNLKRSKDIPVWVADAVKSGNNGEWPYLGSGIILINEVNKKYIVLEEGVHLDVNVPEIQTGEAGFEGITLPDVVPYPNWFEINTTDQNTVLAEFKIHINLDGKTILDQYNIPSRFPAIIKSGNGAPIYYFCGNFSQYDVRMITAKLAGIRTFEKLFYSNKPHSNSKFYWTYYLPLVSEIIDDYQQESHPE